MDYTGIMKTLNSALAGIEDRYAAIAAEHGLTYNALMFAWLVAEGDSVTQADIGKALYLSKSTVHSILKNFCDLGWMKLTSGENRKEKNIILTKKGKKAVSPILEETAEFERSLLDGLGKKRCRALVEIAEYTKENVLEQEISFR